LPNIKYDWSLPEKAFVTAADTYPLMTLKIISTRFNIPYQTIRARAASCKWTRQRLNYIIPLRLEHMIETAKNRHVRAGLIEDLKIYKASLNHTFN
jgi:hypothetical protein